jgi:hypothetical protein
MGGGCIDPQDVCVHSFQYRSRKMQIPSVRASTVRPTRNSSSFTLKMVTAVYTEVLEQFQQTHEAAKLLKPK